MIKREDLPPGMPQETADRIMAMSARTRGISASSTKVAVLAWVTIGVAFFGITYSLGWPLWIHSLWVPIVLAAGKLSEFLGAPTRVDPIRSLRG